MYIWKYKHVNMNIYIYIYMNMIYSHICMSLCSHIIHAYIHPCHGSLGRSGYVSAVPDTAKKIPCFAGTQYRNLPWGIQKSCKTLLLHGTEVVQGTYTGREATKNKKLPSLRFLKCSSAKQKRIKFSPAVWGTFLTYETINRPPKDQTELKQKCFMTSWHFDLSITSRSSSKGHLVPPWWWEPYDFRGSTLRSWQVFGRARKNEPWTFSTVHPFCRGDSEA